MIREIIQASDALVQHSKKSTFADGFVPALSSLGRGKVLRISPESGKNVRGVWTAVGRISNRAGIKVAAWIGDDVVYLEKG